MWVSRKEWDKLQERLRIVEQGGATVGGSDVFTVYDQETVDAAMRCGGFMYPWHMADKQIVTVKEAVEKILAHLGLQLTYVKGTPTTTALEKVKK